MGYFFFGTPFLVLTDLDLTKQIFIKDFDHFTDRRKIEVGHEYLDKMMFVLTGETWREMRSVISPVFTSGKLKVRMKYYIIINWLICHDILLLFEGHERDD